MWAMTDSATPVRKQIVMLKTAASGAAVFFCTVMWRQVARYSLTLANTALNIGAVSLRVLVL